MGCSSSKITVQNYTGEPVEKLDISYHDYWTAVRMGEPMYVDSLENITAEEKEFAKGMQLIVENKITEALPIMEQIYASKPETDTSYLKYFSKNILYHYYLSENRHDSCYSLNYRYNTVLNTEQGKAADIFTELKKQKPFTYTLTANADTLPIIKNKYNFALIEVEINGKVFKMIYDTGAMVTVLSKDIAAQCKCSPITGKINLMGSSNIKTLETFESIIDSIQIGGSKFSNLVAVVSNAGHIKFGIPFIYTFFECDGIIGWDIIKHFKSEFDFENKRIVLQQPIKDENTNPNLFWLGHPIVKTMDSRGMPFNFFYDSGANTSSFTKIMVQKLPAVDLGHKFSISWGLGGSVWNCRETYPQVNTLIKGKQVDFFKMPVEEDADGIFIYDFIAGNDISNGGKIIFDPVNGVFEIISKTELGEK